MVFSLIFPQRIHTETSLLRCNMSLSNWKGSSGWLSIEDPTGVLNGICLQASSGIGQLCEDYLIQEIGTSNAFNKKHYIVQCDLAYKNDQYFNGSVSLVARASDYTTVETSPYIPRQGYLGIIDFDQKLIQIVRRFDAKDFLVFSKNLEYNITPNTKNEISLSCYGNPESGGTTVTIRLNGNILGSFTDNSGTQILSGEAGFQVMNGTVYINNFAVLELDSAGKAV